jgi:2-succinyl-6-hydroxy-2,4-cyclohexadiene-1-carboxylate synthase
MSEGRTLGLIHGFTGSPASWDPVLEALDDAISLGLDVRRPAVLGHGGPMHCESLIDEAKRLLDVICAETPRVDLLCGYSLGGRLALTAALHNPERVKRLVLIGAHPGLEAEAARATRRRDDQRWIELLEREGIDAFIDAWEALPLFADQRELAADLRAAHRQRRVAHDPARLAASLRRLGLGQMPPTQPDLGRLTMPVQLVIGERDIKFRQLASELRKGLPQARLELIGGCGHDVVLGAPEALAALLEAELRR